MQVACNAIFCALFHSFSPIVIVHFGAGLARLSTSEAHVGRVCFHSGGPGFRFSTRNSFESRRSGNSQMPAKTPGGLLDPSEYPAKLAATSSESNVEERSNVFKFSSPSSINLALCRFGAIAE
jgi:hypothetical protein